MTYLSVALGGAIGAVLRYGLTGWVQSAGDFVFPLGTLTVNLLGSLVIGVVLELSVSRFMISPELRIFLTTGICGALTTFSTFSYETLRLIEDQQWGSAGANVALNVLVCLAATYAGVLLVRTF
jgi:CrcB protein